jgi:hypothetical protein
MIKLYRKTYDPAADKIEARFRELVLSYKTIISDDEPGSGKLPRIRDAENIITGDEQIEQWLQDLAEELKWQRSISGDGCYIDPESGEVC